MVRQRRDVVVVWPLFCFGCGISPLGAFGSLVVRPFRVVILHSCSVDLNVVRVLAGSVRVDERLGWLQVWCCV